MQCATANYLLSARLQTISIEETVNYLDAPLSTKDFRGIQIIGEGSNRRWVASLQPHHPARPSAASNNPTPTPLIRARRPSAARLSLTYSAKTSHSMPAGSPTPLSPTQHNPVVLDVFGEGNPLHACRFPHPALPAALLKALHPRAFLQPRAE